MARRLVRRLVARRVMQRAVGGEPGREPFGELAAVQPGAVGLHLAEQQRQREERKEEASECALLPRKTPERRPMFPHGRHCTPAALRSPAVIVYLDGRFLPVAEARISPEDRGFLFGDALYETVVAYSGRLFCWPHHLGRLRAGLQALEIPFEPAPLEAIAGELLARNGLGAADASIYLHITRGVAPRAHAFPVPAPQPTVYATAAPWRRHPPERFSAGVAAVTVPDLRWARCDLKTTALVANVLAQQRAVLGGAFEALQVRDGVVLEGSHSSFFAVLDGALVTYPECNYILPGVTRGLVLELAAELGIPVRLGPLFVTDLARLAEAFVAGTTTEILPVVDLDGKSLADGRPGPVTRRLRTAWETLVTRFAAGEGGP